MPATDRLDPDKIRANLKTKRIGRRVLVYNRTTSTNDIAADYARNKQNDGLAIFAEEQTAGRGRTGAKWHSGRGDSILCSIVLTDCKPDAELLSLTCAVAVAEAVGKIGRSEARVRWPNDIVVNGKKVAGILLESKFDSGTYILGVGINCHQKKDSLPPELQATATSIDIESESVGDRVLLAKRLLLSIERWLELVERNSEKVTEQWSKLSTQLGHRVTLLFNGQKFTGNCIGIDPEKGLILQLETGGVRMFNAAQTAIVK